MRGPLEGGGEACILGREAHSVFSPKQKGKGKGEHRAPQVRRQATELCASKDAREQHPGQSLAPLLPTASTVPTQHSAVRTMNPPLPCTCAHHRWRLARRLHCVPQHSMTEVPAHHGLPAGPLPRCRQQPLQQWVGPGRRQQAHCSQGAELDRAGCQPAARRDVLLVGEGGAVFQKVVGARHHSGVGDLSRGGGGGQGRAGCDQLPG